MQLRKAKGLSLNCDEKFTPTHKCANRRLLLLQWIEEPPDNSTTDVTEFVVEVEDNSPIEEPVPKLFVNAMNSALVSATTRFSGKIKGHSVKILLDGGSDNSFIQQRLAKFLNSDIQPTNAFKVLFRNRQVLEVEGYINKLPVKVQGYTLRMSVFPLPIAGAEIILGAAWLATLGAHMVDYSTLSIQFYHNGQFVTLHGDKK